MRAEDIHRTFKKGTRVRVIKCDSYVKDNLTGENGTVIENGYSVYGKIKVELDTVRNPRARHGCFYFQPHELEVVNEANDDILKENTMNNNNITNYLNLVKIEYVEDKKISNHTYANFDGGIVKGDMVIVSTPYAGLALGTVVEVIERNDVDTTNEVVCKVDTTAYDTRVANRAKAAELKAKMRERAKQLQDIALYIKDENYRMNTSVN